MTTTTETRDVVCCVVVLLLFIRLQIGVTHTTGTLPEIVYRMRRRLQPHVDGQK